MKTKNKVSFGVLILFLLLMWVSTGFGGTSYRPNRAFSSSSITVDADQVNIDDVGNIITATEVEGALQENRTAIDLNTTHKTSDGSDHGFIDQDVTSGSSPTFGNPIVSDAINLDDAVNLRILLNTFGVVLNFWISNQILTTTLTDSELSLQETPSTDPETLSTITFKSTVLDTPTPFEMEAGDIVEIHFSADVTSISGKHDETLIFQLGYVDADGTSNFVQIGTNSDATTVLTDVKTVYESHIHVAVDTAVPAGKRLWLKVIADVTDTGGSYPEINFYYDDLAHHISFGVSGDILGNFLQLSGGNMTGELRKKFAQVDKSTDAVTLTVLETSDTVITNRGWDGVDDQTFTLPDADTDVGKGLKSKLLGIVPSGSTADTYIDTEGTTTKIYLNGTVGADGHRIWTEEIAIGDSIVCHTATLDGTTWDWFCDAINGTWLDKGS